MLRKTTNGVKMSSTNRSNARDNHKHDKYFTPIDAVTLFLREFHKVQPMEWKGRRILDPSAGGDQNHVMPYPEAIKQVHPDVLSGDIMTIDIREDSRARIKADYLTYDVWKINGYPPEIIITNPPFDNLQKFLEKSLTDVCDNGWVIMLLRLNYFESKERKSFWEQFMPQYCFVHHKRISFQDDGKTDSCAYMHACWKKNHYSTFAKIKVI